MSAQTVTPTFVTGDFVSIRELGESCQEPGVVVFSDGQVTKVDGEVVTVRIHGDLNKFAPRASDGVFERLGLPNRTLLSHISMYRTKPESKTQVTKAKNLFKKIAGVFG